MRVPLFLITIFCLAVPAFVVGQTEETPPASEEPAVEAPEATEAQPDESIPEVDVPEIAGGVTVNMQSDVKDCNVPGLREPYDLESLGYQMADFRGIGISWDLSGDVILSPASLQAKREQIIREEMALAQGEWESYNLQFMLAAKYASVIAVGELGSRLFPSLPGFGARFRLNILSWAGFGLQADADYHQHLSSIGLQDQTSVVSTLHMLHAKLGPAWQISFFDGKRMAFATGILAGFMTSFGESNNFIAPETMVFTLTVSLEYTYRLDEAYRGWTIGAGIDPMLAFDTKSPNVIFLLRPYAMLSYRF